ncbi:MAG: hypothetical protein NVSMB31_00950 [Vulcanimicrobiaceae bacterium]
MTFDSVDNYLLFGTGSKAEVIAKLLADRSEEPAAAPFYRALELLGARVADEALIALRLVLAGKPAADDVVKRMRECVAVSRAQGEAGGHARQAYERELR